MTRLELVGGDFGSGTAYYEAGEFRLPKGRLQSVENVSALEANQTIVQKNWGRAVLAGAKNAAGLAPVAMLVGVFAAPLAVIGTIGIAAAAVGGAAGLLGGGSETKALIQVTFAQGTGFVAVCELALVDLIRNDISLLQAQAAREKRRLEPPKQGWFSRKPAEPRPVAPVPVALPPPPEPSQPSAEAEPGVLSNAADSLTAVASSAVDVTGQALSGAFAFAKRATGLDKK